MTRILVLAVFYDLGRWLDRHGHVWVWSVMQRLGAGEVS